MQVIETLIEVQLSGYSIRVWYAYEAGDSKTLQKLFGAGGLEGRYFSSAAALALWLAGQPGVNAVQVGGLPPDRPGTPRESVVVYNDWP